MSGQGPTAFSPCSVLGVSTAASFEEIRAAYRKHLLRTHPDKGGDLDQFHKLQIAFEALKKAHQSPVSDVPVRPVVINGRQVPPGATTRTTAHSPKAGSQAHPDVHPAYASFRQRVQASQTEKLAAKKRKRGLEEEIAEAFATLPQPKPKPKSVAKQMAVKRSKRSASEDLFSSPKAAVPSEPAAEPPKIPTDEDIDRIFGVSCSAPTPAVQVPDVKLRPKATGEASTASELHLKRPNNTAGTGAPSQRSTPSMPSSATAATAADITKRAAFKGAMLAGFEVWKKLRNLADADRDKVISALDQEVRADLDIYLQERRKYLLVKNHEAQIERLPRLPLLGCNSIVRPARLWKALATIVSDEIRNDLIDYLNSPTKSNLYEYLQKRQNLRQKRAGVPLKRQHTGNVAQGQCNASSSSNSSSSNSSSSSSSSGDEEEQGRHGKTAQATTRAHAAPHSQVAKSSASGLKRQRA